MSTALRIPPHNHTIPLVQAHRARVTANYRRGHRSYVPFQRYIYVIAALIGGLTSGKSEKNFLVDAKRSLWD